MKLFDYPTGSIVQFPSVGKTPAGWIICDGRSLNGNDPAYINLWNLIGNTFGGTGKSSFYLPDLQGRIPVGQTATPSGTGLSGAIGSWTGVESVTLTSAQSAINHTHGFTDPGHTHSISDGGHTHTVNVTSTTTYSTYTAGSKGFGSYTITENVMSAVNVDVWDSNTSATTSTLTNLSMGNTSVSFGTISTVDAQNASSAHTNLQPTIYMKHLIKI